MQRLTTAGRLIIALVVVAAVYFGFRYFGGGRLAPSAPVATTGGAPNGTAPDGTAPDGYSGATDGPTPTAGTTATGGTSSSFTFMPPAPVNGKLKGVVELGASGFNSFIVRIDGERNWKLEKAEFGNSLVLENMASDDDVRKGLKSYIGQMLDFGVGGRDIHFVVSSGAVKAEGTKKIISALKSLNYVVNTVTPELEGTLGLKAVLPPSYASKSFVVDIGSGNTKISWAQGGTNKSVESYGAKYFQNATDDATVAADVKAKAQQVPQGQRQTCFIIGGVPFEMAKISRVEKERYTVLKNPADYQLDNAKSKAGLNIYRAVAEATGCQQFVFDWDANFTIGYLLSLPQ